MQELRALKLKLGRALLHAQKVPTQQQQGLRIWHPGSSMLSNIKAQQAATGDAYLEACKGCPAPTAPGDYGCKEKQKLRALQRQLALALAGTHPPRPPLVKGSKGLPLVDGNLKGHSHVQLSTSRKACQ